MAGSTWSQEEITVTVQSYFRMLNFELEGTPYSKAGENAVLRARLDNRSKGAVEFKHQNISAVLAGLGMRYIDGYKPRRNFQVALRDEVRRVLRSDAILKLTLAQGDPGLALESIDSLMGLPIRPSQESSSPAGDNPQTQRLGSSSDELIKSLKNADGLRSMTKKSKLALWVLEALSSLGGHGNVVQVCQRVWQVHEIDLRSAGELFFTWQYDIRWAAQRLRNDMLLIAVNGDRRSEWELSPTGWDAVTNQGVANS